MYGSLRTEIVRALKGRPQGFWLLALLEPGYTAPQRFSLQRAAHSLEGEGHITIEHRASEGYGRLWIGPGRRKLPELPPARFIEVRVPMRALLKEAE